ncbi:protein kinase family protein [Niallia nealsonii]|uniref:Serine/threonine protein kinase n=1 Tax=Niallia nealsonii TaxID=115979 RepID=A0A2N0YWJ6_9BACI|nr:protein kinase family protein [Niallia nealsonii]PKG21625.1 serine/threonine protein kinase [Niallia nealsonii]
MKYYESLAKSIHYNFLNKSYSESKKHSDLQLIGKGRSAYCFKIKHTDVCLKVFFEKYEHLAKEEGEIYETVKGIPYFPKVYEIGKNYLVMDYIEGTTLFDCLIEGIVISENHIKETDYAISLSKEKGLNPSDIHLKNIILTKDNGIKIIDLARFRQQKKCKQWHDLKTAFYKIYQKRYFPKKVSKYILHTIRILYKRDLLKSLFQ